MGRVFSTRSLLKVRLDGGTPLTVTTGIGTNAGAAWSPDNSIVFAVRSSAEGPTGLYRVSADGGTAESITVTDSSANEFAHRWPHILPDGQTILFAVGVNGENGPYDMMAAVPMEGGQHRLIGNGADPRYVEPGFVTFSDGAGSIMAQPFDVDGLELTGSRFRIAEGASWRGSPAGLTEYDVSRNGTLIFRESGGALSQGQEEIVLISMDGDVEVVTERGPMRHPRFSPDGRFLAFEQEATTEQEYDDIWVWDLQRSIPIRVTFEADNSFPVWEPGGERVLFETGSGIYARRADGSGETELLVEMPGNKPLHVSPDGGWLLWTQYDDGNANVWMLRFDGSAEAQPLLSTPFNEDNPAVSPDGRWIAYTSDESGDSEVYVEPFPDRGRRFKVTSGGAWSPVWSPDGSRLYYRRLNPPNIDLEAVDVRPGSLFDVGPAEVLFPSAGYGGGQGTLFDVSPDGTQFVFVRTGAGGAEVSEWGDTHVVITNALNPGLEGGR